MYIVIILFLCVRLVFASEFDAYSLPNKVSSYDIEGAKIDAVSLPLILEALPKINKSDFDPEIFDHISAFFRRGYYFDPNMPEIEDLNLRAQFEKIIRIHRALIKVLYTPTVRFHDNCIPVVCGDEKDVAFLNAAYYLTRVTFVWDPYPFYPRKL